MNAIKKLKWKIDNKLVVYVYIYMYTHEQMYAKYVKKHFIFIFDVVVYFSRKLQMIIVS